MKLPHVYHWLVARHRSRPDPIFKAALLKKLIGETVAQSRPQPRHSFGLMRLSFAVLAGLVVVGSVSTATYAYNSPAVTVDSPLYPIKRNLEKVEEKLQRTPAQKVAFDLKQIARREAEASTLRAKRKATVDTEVEINQVEKKLERHTVQLSVESQYDSARERLTARALARLKQAEAKQAAKADRIARRQAAAEKKVVEGVVDQENQQAVAIESSSTARIKMKGKNNFRPQLIEKDEAVTTTLSENSVTTTVTTTPQTSRTSPRRIIEKVLNRYEEIRKHRSNKSTSNR